MNKANSIHSNSSKYHVPNLERALRVFELLAQHPEGLSTSRISELLQFPRNSIFRITATLHNHGYLIRDLDTKLFQLSQKLLTLGYAAISEQTLVEKSLDVMRSLRDRFKETVPLGILQGNQGLVIEEVPGIHSFRFVLEPGKRFNLHTSAPGKAIVAYLPEDEKEKLIDSIKFIKFNERTISNKSDFIKELTKVRQQGWAADCAEETEGMHCIGAPIFNRHGIPFAAIWITGPSSRVKEENFQGIGEEVRRHSNKISQSLGYGIAVNNHNTS